MLIYSIVKKSALFALVLAVAVLAHQNVLVLNSYNQGFVKTDEITRAIQDVLRKSNVNIYIEDLDMNKEMFRSMFQKYIDIGTKFDVIITVDQIAFNYVKNNENVLWKNVPVVACAISNKQAESVMALDSANTGEALESTDSSAVKKSLWSGIYDFYDVPGQIDFIQRIQSHVKRVIFITDNTDISDEVREQLNSTISMQKNIDLEEWRKPSLESLADSLGKLNPDLDAVVLVGIELNGSTKNPQRLWQDLTKRIDSNSTAPVYSFWDTGIQNGVIGGNVILAPLMGKNIGLIVESILAGNDTYNSGFRRSASMSMVDDNAAKKRKLKLDRLPPETIILNKPESWLISKYQQYVYNMKNAIIAELIIILLLGFSFYSYFKYSNRKILKEKIAAEKASKAKSLFLANMSHEIRTPLNSMLGFSELLLNKSSNLNEEQKEWCNNIEISSYHLRDTFNNILDFSKIEAGSLKIDYEWVDIFELCDDLISVCNHYLIYKPIKFYVLPSIYMPKYIKTDRIRLKLVLVNLISNAMKFTAEGSVKLLINPKNERNEENMSKIHFEVVDTGIGIPKEKIKKIFEPFEQIDSGRTRKYGGAGLGLTISKNILQAMNSDIEVQSDKRGSLFSFTLSVKTREDAFYKKFLTEKKQKVVIYNSDAKVLSYIKECVIAIDGTAEETIDLNTIFYLNGRDLLIAEADKFSDAQILKISELFPKVILIFHGKTERMLKIKLYHPTFECILSPVKNSDVVSVLQRLYVPQSFRN